MYKRILVPLDGSELAEKVLSHPKAMAAAWGAAEIDLIFVVEPLSAAVASQYFDKDKEDFSQLDKRAEAWSKGYLAKISQNLKEDGIAAKSIKSIVLIGKPAETIVDYATKNAVDLIVMSTHGRSGLTRWAIGSVAEKVISTSTSPVLIVRPES
jgi:nucleotide-binding universal stress UspA family protein